jgi:carboxymethylenebutenolidase
VVQEWWGLDSGIKATTDRLGAAGFVALAPDLYHGELAGHDEMDKAGQLMQSLPPDRAARDMSGAIDYLAGLDGVTGRGIGVIGFCMGGMLSLIIAAKRPDKIKAAVPFYGFPQGDAEPDWSALDAKVRGHMAENDDFFGPVAARALEAKLRGMGKDVTFTVHPGTGHAFMGPHNALGTLDEELASEIWPQVLAFLHETLD